MPGEPRSHDKHAQNAKLCIFYNLKAISLKLRISITTNVKNSILDFFFLLDEYFKMLFWRDIGVLTS